MSFYPDMLDIGICLLIVLFIVLINFVILLAIKEKIKMIEETEGST